MRLLLVLLAACRPAPEPGPQVVPADLGLPPVVDEVAPCVATTLHRWDPPHMAVQADALADLGAAVVRQDMRWYQVQRTPGSWAWETEDAVVDAITDGVGAEMIAMLGYGAPWATDVPGADEFHPPDDPEDFAAFAGAAAARYADRVHRFEIWNEPNAGYRFWKGGATLSGDPAAYADLFVAAAEAVHDRAPDAEVVLGSVFFHEQGIIGGVRFLQEALAARPDLLDHADAVSFHPYTLYPPRTAPEITDDLERSLPDMIADVRAVTGALPIVVTEAGWPSSGPIREDDQADFLVRGTALAHAEGVREWCWYTLEDKEQAGEHPEHSFGLTHDGATTRKPAGQAFAALSRLLSRYPTAHGRADDALALPDGALATRYTGPDGALTVVWTVDGRVDVILPPIAEGCPPVSLTATETPALVEQHDACG